MTFRLTIKCEQHKQKSKLDIKDNQVALQQHFIKQVAGNPKTTTDTQSPTTQQL